MARVVRVLVTRETISSVRKVKGYPEIVMIGAMAAVTIYTKDDGKKDKKE